MTARSEARRQFLHDVFVTALEGGIGYWSVATEYHWSLPGTEGKSVADSCDLDGFYAEIEETEQLGEDGKIITHRIDRDVIVLGISRIMRARAPYYDPNSARTQCAQVKFLSKGVADIVRSASHDNDGSDIDAGVADDIVQVGLFGEVVYG